MLHTLALIPTKWYNLATLILGVMKKKFIYLIILILPLALLTACGKKERPSLDDRIGGVSTESESYEGTLERLEMLDVYQQGTHQLDTGGVGVVILQSPTIDLNRYLDEEVLVKGFIEKGIGDAKDVFTVTEISYVDETKSVELEDYENKLFGFQFSHPNSWLLDEGTGDLGLKFEEKEVVSIAVFSDETDLDGFASGREDTDPKEVTVGSQRSLRFVSGGELGFYVPNPPKKKVYLIKYSPSINAVDDEKGAEAQRELFYDLLDSFELIYTSQPQGEKCGGLQQVECAEEHICQLESDGKYAEGVCVPINGEAGEASCPFIAPPTSCEEYRISEYSQKGCPSRYECVGEGTQTESASFRDLNVVDAGKKPEDLEEESEEGEDESEVVVMEKDEEDESGQEADYDVPDTSSVTALYVNERKGFSLLMPKTWYYASFGPVDGTLWKVGFADGALEEADQSVITMSLMEKPGGSAYKKIDELYYVFDGPADLTDVMEKMASSVELTE